MKNLIKFVTMKWICAIALLFSFAFAQAQPGVKVENLRHINAFKSSANYYYIIVDTIGPGGTRIMRLDSFIAEAAIVGPTGWTLTGNSGTTPVTNFVGTTDNTSLWFQANSINSMRLDSLGHLQLGYPHSVTGYLQFNQAADAHSVTLRAPNTSLSYSPTFLLPGTYPAGNGYALISTTGGTMGWSAIPSLANAWGITGNAGTTAGTNFIGTTDGEDLVFKTNGTEWMRILNGGNIGIGTSSPAFSLDVAGSTGARIQNTLTLGVASSLSGNINWKSSGGSSSITMQAPSSLSTYTLTLPTSLGTNGQALVNTSFGALGWASLPTGAVGTTGQVAYFGSTNGVTGATGISATNTTLSILGSSVVTGSSTSTGSSACFLPYLTQSNKSKLSTTAYAGGYAQIYVDTNTYTLHFLGADGNANIDMSQPNGWLQMAYNNNFSQALTINDNTGNLEYSGGGFNMNNTGIFNVAQLTLGNADAVYFTNSGGTGGISLSNSSGNYSLILPSSQGAASTFLKNDGSGNLSWATGASGPTGPTGSAGSNGASGPTGPTGTFSTTFQTLTDGATITWTGTSGFYGKVTLGGNRTLAMSGWSAGQSGWVKVIQPSSGGPYTLTSPSSSYGIGFSLSGGGGNFPLSSAASAFDIITVTYDGTYYYFGIGNNGQ